MTRYVLPELAYDYGALEPHISGKIMELHHDKHHSTYVKGANEAIEQLLEARAKEDWSGIVSLEERLAFHVSGHVLHSLFWKNLAPPAHGGGERPSGALAAAIERDFGSFELFKKQLNHVASSIMGSGWAALVWEPVCKRLGTSQIHDHQSEITQGQIPLLVLDAWEHAYYLQYQTEKAKYFDAVWHLWNWNDVAARFEKARAADLQLGEVAQAHPLQ
jgi:Fe-Mn family superoxide dismutase